MLLNLLAQINTLGVLAATAASFVLGGVYFVALIAKPYRVAMGRKGEASAKPGPLFMFGPLVCNLVVIITTALLLKALGIETYGAAVEFGLVVGIGYLTAMTMNIAINPNFPRPFLYTALNAPYFIMTSLMTSLILTAMG